MTCTPDTTHALWHAFNKARAHTIKVPRAALNDALACHGTSPIGLVVSVPSRSDAKFVRVNRAALFAFLNAHAQRRCDAP